MSGGARAESDAVAPFPHLYCSFSPSMFLGLQGVCETVRMVLLRCGMGDPFGCQHSNSRTPSLALRGPPHSFGLALLSPSFSASFAARSTHARLFGKMCEWRETEQTRDRNNTQKRAPPPSRPPPTSHLHRRTAALQRLRHDTTERSRLCMPSRTALPLVPVSRVFIIRMK